MATVTVSASTTLALLGHGLDDDIVGTGAATLTCDSNPNALPAIRSIRSSSPRFTFKVRNSATAFSAGNLWKLSFTNPGAAIGASAGTLGFTSGATCDFEGEFLECYTATGAAGETVLDASNVLGVDIDLPYAVQVESAPGSGVWDWVVVAIIGGVGNGYLVTASQSNFGTGLLNRVLFYDHTTRLLKTGDGTNGTLFASGTKFRIPNIMGWIPPFTLTTAAGWTTGTGSQPVVSSTNAPLSSYLVGSEVVSVNSLPGGTSVNVNTRSVDGTTAAAPAAGVTMYCLPDDGITSLAGKIVGENGGVYRFKRCFFGRWWAPRIRLWAIAELEDMGFVSPAAGGARPTGITDDLSMSRVTLQVNPVRGLQSGWAISNNNCPTVVSGLLVVSHVSSVSTTSLSQNNNANLIGLNGNTQLSAGNLRAHAVGIASTSNFGGRVNIAIQTNVVPAQEIDGIESVGGRVSIVTGSAMVVSGIRYSATNGPLNTTTADVAIETSSQGNPLIGATIRDYDVIDGGVAPYQAWFAIGGGTQNCYLHNQIGGTVGSRGSPRTINCQSRTAQFTNSGGGAANTLAAVYLSSMRAGSTVMNGFPHRSTVRNVRTANVTNAPQLSGGSPTFDFPPGPQGGTTLYDMPVIYAYPDTYPPTTGVLRVGGFPREIERDLWDISGTGVFHDPGNNRFQIETSGDVVLIKSALPVAGIGSIPASGSVTFSGTSATSGITYEFRLCNWGADISAVSWATFDRATFKTAFDALTGYTSENGLNVQIRATATTSVAGRTITQMNMPVNMNASHNPAVGTVPLGLIGANAGATAAFYATFYTSEGLLGSATTDGSGAASLSAPYDYDDVPITYRIKVRALEGSSVDVTGTYTQQGATAPTPQQALTGYVAGPDTGVTWTKVGARVDVNVTGAMSNQDLWSRYRRFIVQFANFDIDDTAGAWSYSGGVLNLGASNITVTGADLTGNLITTGTATQASGGRFIGVVQASNGSSGVLTVTGLTASQVYLQNDSAVQQDYQPSQTGTYTYPTPFGATGTWRLVVNKEGYFPQTFDFDPGQSNEFAVTLQALRNPDGTLLYQAGSYPEIACTFVTAGNMRIRFGVEVTLQKIVDATQQAYSTAAGMAWLAAGNAELTAAILSAGQFIFLPERSRLFGTALDAALASFAVSADGSVVDPATDFPIRYVQPPSVAGSAEEIAAAIRADQVTELLRIIELARLHGLDASAPLVVTPTTRTAGSIEQSLTTVGDEVTVTRTA